MLKTSVISDLLNRWSVILTDFPGIILFEIDLKHTSKGTLSDCYCFINTASSLQFTCHVAEIIKMWKHLLNLSHGPTSHQTLATCA